MAQLVFTNFVFLFVTIFIYQNDCYAQSEAKNESKVTFTVTTYDGLELPAQVVHPQKEAKKLVLFINGSTPSDEKGNLCGSWDENGKRQIT